MLQIYSKKISSPMGILTLLANNQGLISLSWKDNNEKNGIFAEEKHGNNHLLLIEAERQITAYFAGELLTFNLPLSLSGTFFQIQVWKALEQVHFAQTCSYGQLAHAIGRDKAVRAVGTALGRNPLPIILPCHRVIGSTGHLTGFTGGLPLKRFLLNHETNVKKMRTEN